MRSVIATLAFVLLLAAPASAATERFASAAGSGNTCSHDAPCQFNMAMIASADGDTVTALAGSHELTSGINITHAITLRGEPGQAVTISGDGNAFGGGLIETFIAGVTIRDLQLKMKSPSGSNLAARAIDSPTTVVVERVRVIAEQQGNGIPVGISVGDGSIIRDSMAIGRGSNSVAVAAGASKILNTTVTSDHIGISSSPCFASADVTTTVVNTIVQGGNDPAGRDFSAFSGKCNVMDPAPFTATIAPKASNYRSSKLEGAVTPPPARRTRSTTPPRWIRACCRSRPRRRSTPASNDPDLGATDFEGQARTQGSAVDIGADEFVAAATTPPPGQQPGPPTGQQPPPPPPAADKTAPALSALKFVKSLKSGKGAKFTFSLSEAATLKISFTRLIPGRKVGGKCKEKAKRGKKCTIAKSLGSLSIPARRARTASAFSGKLKGKKLPAGSYKVSVVAVDAAGNKAKVKTLALKVTR